jgi:hypothetical protein
MNAGHHFSIAWEGRGEFGEMDIIGIELPHHTSAQTWLAGKESIRMESAMGSTQPWVL